MSKDQATVTARMLDIPKERSTIHLTVNQLPDIKNWKVGSTYNLSLKVKQTAMQEGGYDGKQPLSADFVVISADDGDGDDSEGYDDKD